MKLSNKIKDIIVWIMISSSLLLMVYNTALYSKVYESPSVHAVQIERGQNLASFHLKKLNGEEFIIPSEGDCLVSFLTTGCNACQRQVQALNNVYKSGRYSQIIAVFFEPDNTVKKFESDHHPEFLCVVDYTGALNDNLKLNSFPQTIELTNGVVTQTWDGLQENFE